VSASASDDFGVTQVQFTIDGSPIGTDTNGSDGWSVSWDTSTVANGNHVVGAVATDTSNQTGSDTNQVTVSNGVSTITVAIPSAADDAEEVISNGTVYRTSGDIDLVVDNTIPQIDGLRFTGVNLPRGATITNATLQFRTDAKSSSPTTLNIQGQLTGNAAAFTSAAFGISTRTRTTATVPWTPNSWTSVGQTGPDQRSPNIASVIQEIVSQSTWTSGNALVLIISGATTGTRGADSYEGGWPTSLSVSYTL
jgi:hypothetical protein